MRISLKVGTQRGCSEVTMRIEVDQRGISEEEGTDGV
jgi:hypothetical protein